MPPKRTRQTRLDFTPAKRRKVTLSDSDHELDAAMSMPKPSVQNDVNTPSKRDVKRGMEMGTPIQHKRNGMFGDPDSDEPVRLDDSSDSSVPKSKNARPKRGETKGKKKTKPAKDSSNKDAPRQTRARAAKDGKGKGKNHISISSDEDSVLGPRSRPVQNISDSESEDEMPEAAPKQARLPSTKRGQPKPSAIELDSDDSEDEIAPLSSRKRRKPVPESNTDSQSDADHNGGGQERADLEEDLDFLRSSPPVDKGRLRSTSSKPLNERQKALEALKRRRGKTTVGEPSSSATPRRKRAVILEDSDSDDLEIIPEEKQADTDVEDDSSQDEDEYDSAIEEVSDDDEAQTYQASSRFDMFQENADDEEFIDDDAEELIGQPSEHTSLPLQFSSLGRAKPRELFKYAVEWMVQKKLNPAFSSNDEIYTLTFRKLDDEVNGLASSKFSSAAWTAEFTRAMKARPDATIEEIGAHMRAISSPHCEACNRKTHPATFNICFTGKPYHKETLEPLVDSDSDASSDSDVSSDSGKSTDSEEEDSQAQSKGREKKTYDATGELIPPESKVFTVGSTCKANAQMAHTLHHWRHHLNSWVIDYLAGKGHLTPKKLAKRDKWSVEKRRKKADKVVDKMDSTGEIQKLYRLYKDQLDYAFEAKNDYKRGWGRK